MSMCKRGIIVLTGIAIFFGFAISSSFQAGESQVSMLWGMLLGIILGITMCLYLSKSYDLKTWEPKNPNSPFAKINGLWGPAVGVFLANIISRFFGPIVGDFVFGCNVTWLLITIGYIVFHSCRSETGEKYDQK